MLICAIIHCICVFISLIYFYIDHFTTIRLCLFVCLYPTLQQFRILIYIARYMYF